MVKLKNLLLKEIAATLEWKDVPQEVKDEAYKLVAEHNRGIDASIKGFLLHRCYRKISGLLHILEIQGN